MNAVVKNDKGTITISSNIIEQVVKDAVANTGGKVRFAKSDPRSIDYTEKGLNVLMNVEIRLGCSMKSTFESIINELRKIFTEQFELEIDNIVVRAVGVFSRRVSKRDISYDMYGNRVNALEEADEEGSD